MNTKRDPRFSQAIVNAKPVVIPISDIKPDEIAAENHQLERTVTQDGIARVFAQRYVGRLRYCYHARAWYCWSGSHWQRDETDVAFEFVRVLAREITETGEAKQLREVRKNAFASGVERYAKSDPAFAVTSAAWDIDRYLLGTPNGTVDLRNGALRRSRPEEGITRISAVAPSATADCPIWIDFLNQATNGDAGAVLFLQQWAGYCLTGDVSEHALVFCYGDGGNGKGVFLNTLVGIMGAYAVVAPADTFTASNHDRHPTELAMLRGARLVAASETEHGRAWAENRIKQLTGGDAITARFMRGDFFTFEPEFKLTIIGNHQPTLANVDAATRRRFNIVPFLHKPTKPDLGLTERLRGEWPAILRWMIDGCLDWQRNRLTRPQSVVAATAAYFEDQDLFGHWLSSSCDVQVTNDRLTEATAKLYASWKAFASQAGEKPGTVKSFSMTMQKRGFQSGRSGAVRFFRGLRISHHDDGSGDR
ncbi:putative DNA primase/helicase [Bradyrhizobium huanghuaihaiense]|uniref:Putative DNA primase/helicase n=1 Tax=Bradyrhizobium huanghuaihaiense TaxID=990078 RepID=A0A562RZC3_9BRAD|nr:phage/plasmid primase, P4 family [Bradyrhizobium huanghuaihaiense]TWI73630.1 putative DNA primase/helicase [Bradyrhizobium huanghuaihaiense]